MLEFGGRDADGGDVGECFGELFPEVSAGAAFLLQGINLECQQLHKWVLTALSPPLLVCADILVSAGVGQGECRKKYRSAVVRACEWRVWILFLERP